MEFSGLLKEYKLSLTQSRLNILEVLDRSGMPMSEKEIEQQMGNSCNRTTVYRNLNTLVDKGVIQRILSDNSLKYKLTDCRAAPANKADHVHFQCRSCNKVICLEELTVKDYDLPEGYLKIENQFLIVGLCKDCNYVGKD